MSQLRLLQKAGRRGRGPGTMQKKPIPLATAFGIVQPPMTLRRTTRDKQQKGAAPLRAATALRWSTSLGHTSTTVSSARVKGDEAPSHLPRPLREDAAAI